jgi:hypothetical protein
MTDDKRSDKRFAIERGVELRFPSGLILHGVTRDLSFSGSFIECDTTGLQVGGECYLSVMLENNEKSTEIFSAIRYQNAEGVGCHFLTFDSGYYQFLTNYSLRASVS